MTKGAIAERRKLLDSIDHHLATVVLQRIEIAGTLVDEKQSAGLPITDTEREDAIVARAAALGLRKGFARALWGTIFREVKRGREEAP